MSTTVIAFFWIVLCIIVAVAANTRGRSPLGWFICAVVLSPLLGGLLLLALPSLAKDEFAVGPVYSEGWLEKRRRRRAIVAWSASALLVAMAV
jgi:hypothetical protein